MTTTPAQLLKALCLSSLQSLFLRESLQQWEEMASCLYRSWQLPGALLPLDISAPPTLLSRDCSVTALKVSVLWRGKGLFSCAAAAIRLDDQSCQSISAPWKQHSTFSSGWACHPHCCSCLLCLPLWVLQCPKGCSSPPEVGPLSSKSAVLTLWLLARWLFCFIKPAQSVPVSLWCQTSSASARLWAPLLSNAPILIWHGNSIQIDYSKLPGLALACQRLAAESAHQLKSQLKYKSSRISNQLIF